MWKTKSKNICKNIPHNIKPLNFIWWVCTYSCSWGRFLITSLQKYTVIIWPWLIWDQWACSINAESEHSMQLRELQQDHLLLLNDAFIGHETISSFWEWFVVQFLSVSQKPSHFYPIYFNGAQTQATAEPSLWTELYHRDIISNFGLFLTESVISDLLYFHRSTLNFMSVLCFLFYFDRLASCVQCFEFFFPLVSLSQISPSCVCLLSPIPFCIYAPCFPVSLCCVVPSQCVSFVLLVLPSLVPWFLNFLVWVSCFWFLV